MASKLNGTDDALGTSTADKGCTNVWLAPLGIPPRPFIIHPNVADRLLSQTVPPARTITVATAR